MTVHTLLRADDVRRSYVRWAGHYDFTFALFGRKYVKKVVNRLNDETHGRNVLDVGTGTGLSLPYFRPDLSITGIDNSEDMLARAKRKKLENIAALWVMDAIYMQFSDGQFDSVLATFVMSVAPDPAAVLAEIARVIRHGGRAYLFNHFRADEEDNRALVMAERAGVQSRFSFRLLPLVTSLCRDRFYVNGRRQFRPPRHAHPADATKGHDANLTFAAPIGLLFSPQTV